MIGLSTDIMSDINMVSSASFDVPQDRDDPEANDIIEPSVIDPGLILCFDVSSMHPYMGPVYILSQLLILRGWKIALP